MKTVTKSIGKTVSFLSGPFLAFCPACNIAPLVTSVGQSTFLVAYAKILGPVTVVLIIISLFSFYYTYKRVHHNIFPFIFALIGGLSYVYINFIDKFGSTFFMFFGLLFLIIASAIDFNLRFSPQRIVSRMCIGDC